VGEIWSDSEVRKNRLNESRTLVRGVNEFLSLLPTNIADLCQSRCMKFAH